MNNLNNITQDWTHADQFLNDKIDKNNNSIKHDFGELEKHVNTSLESVENEVKMLNGVAEGQFITDSAAKMVKVVPDGVNKGVVSMVGGKTVKCKNLCNPSNTTNATLNGNVWSFSNAITAFIDLTGVLSPNTAYTISAITSGVIRLALASSAGTYEYGYKSINGTDSFQVTTPSSLTSTTKIGIAFYEDSLSSKTVTNLQIEKGTTATSYESYHADLWNAPVKKVVLEGKNLFDKSKAVIGKRMTNTATYLNGASTGCSEYIPILANTDYYLTNVNGLGAFYSSVFFDKDKKLLGTVDVNGAQKASGTVHSLNNAAYMVINFMLANIDTVMVERGTTTTGYAPYVNKTTLSLERIVDKLPDYGASVNDNLYNYVDFEAEKYFHVVSSKKLVDCRFIQMATAGLFFVQDDIVPVEKILSSKYSFVDVAANSNDEANALLKDKEMTYRHGTNDRIYFKDTSSSSVDEFMKNNADVEIVYGLNNSMIEEIPLTDLLLPFKCEPGGTVTFENEHNLDVPNLVIYEKEMK